MHKLSTKIMQNATDFLMIFVIFEIFINFSHGDRRCGYNKFFNKEINDCSDCHNSCKECNGTSARDCQECFNSKNHQLCKWEKGYYCLEDCSKVPKIQDTTPEITTVTNNTLQLNFNIIHALLLLLLIVTVPFVCIIIILIIIYKYNQPRPRSKKTKHLDIESSEINEEINSMLSEPNKSQKFQCQDQSKFHKECRAGKSCSVGSKRSKAEKYLTVEVQSEPKNPQKQNTTNPPHENVEVMEPISSKTRMALNNLQENLVIASKISFVPNSFKTEQLDWHKKILLSDKGAFGKVYKCVYKDGEKCYHVAVKEPKRKTNEPFNEERIMSQLKDHPHIVKLITTRLDENMLLVMPLLKCSLSEYLHSESNPTITQKLRYCQQIANGMSYLTFKRIVHCDLKASNVLVVNENFVQISDFGKSERIDDINRSRRPVIGTITHTAKELLNPFSRMLNCEATDVWSFGVTIWEIFNEIEHIPYADCVCPLNETTIADFLHAKNHLQTTFWPSKETSPALVSAASYMMRCLLHEPLSRPTFGKLWYWFSTLLPEGLNLISKEESTIIDRKFN